MIRPELDQNRSRPDRPLARALAMALLSVGVGLSAPVLAQTEAEPCLPLPYAADEARPSIVGAWEVTVVPSDPGIPPFLGFYNFFSDGNAIFSSAGPPLPALGNPGHGAWRRVGSNVFDVVIRQNTFDETLQANGSLRIESRVCLTALNRFVTSDDVKIYDPEGNEVVTLGGSARAQRLLAIRSAK